MKDYLEDYYKLLETKADIDAFKDKFGEDNYERFVRLRDRLRNLKDKDNNNINVDLTWHTKNTDVDDLLKLLDRAERREYKVNVESKLDIDGKLIPEPAHTKQLLYDKNKVQIWFVTDYTDMIEMSEGTGKGTIGGRKTGWCIGGRYEIPYGEVKVSQAKQYFDGYKTKYRLDGYIVVITPKNKFCIIARNGMIINITDSDDNDHSDFKYINNFILKLPAILKVLAKVNILDKNDDENIIWLWSYDEQVVNKVELYNNNLLIAELETPDEVYESDTENVTSIDFYYDNKSIGLYFKSKYEAVNALKLINSKYDNLKNDINIKHTCVTGPVDSNKYKDDPDYIFRHGSSTTQCTITGW